MNFYEDTSYTYISILANILSLFSNVPQIYKTLKTQKADDISTRTLLLKILSSLLWLIYTIKYYILSMVISNIISITCNTILLTIKYREYIYIIYFYKFGYIKTNIKKVKFDIN